MNEDLINFEMGDLNVRFKRSVLVAGVVMVIVLALISWVFLGFGLFAAILFGLVCTLTHVDITFLHQLGHSIAARQTGYPMKGMTFYYALAKSIYPSDEPKLPPSVHMQRAIGGPILSFVVFIVLAIATVIFQDVSPFLYSVALFLALDSLIIFVVGALIPTPARDFNDGDTLLRYWREMQDEAGSQ